MPHYFLLLNSRRWVLLSCTQRPVGAAGKQSRDMKFLVELGGS